MSIFFSREDIGPVIAAWLRAEARKVRHSAHEALDEACHGRALEQSAQARMMDSLADRAQRGEWAWDCWAPQVVAEKVT